MSAGLLTIYTTTHSNISSSPAYQYSQAYLHPTVPGTVRLAAASRINGRQSTYILQHTVRLAAASRINVYRYAYKLHHQIQQD
jgi:hypothetical protein